jgi:hypothetical protein
LNAIDNLLREGGAAAPRGIVDECAPETESLPAAVNGWLTPELEEIGQTDEAPGSQTRRREPNPASGTSWLSAVVLKWLAYSMGARHFVDL